VWEAAGDLFRIARLPDGEAGPLHGVFSINRRPSTDGKWCDKKQGKWMAKSSAGWIPIPHPPADGGKGGDLRWTPNVLVQRRKLGGSLEEDGPSPSPLRAFDHAVGWLR
jgi:hypothetical protein